MTRAEITVYDPYSWVVAFCAGTLGAYAVNFTENPAQLRFDQETDLIWCSSLLTITLKSSLRTLCAAL